MEFRKPVDAVRVQAHFNAIAPIIESPGGQQAQAIIYQWNRSLYSDLGEEAETLMLVGGQGVSDRFLYGFCAAIVSMQHENGGNLPELPVDAYEANRDVQAQMHAAEVGQATEYFGLLEDDFYERFPLTATLLAYLEEDLRSRAGVPETDIQDGFIPGWYEALKVVMPLFRQE